MIADGFYDVGQLKDSVQLRSVEEYGREEVNERRPVIVINPKSESVNILLPFVVIITQPCI